jgi:molecular chaperone GrpE (heat shock protein)
MNYFKNLLAALLGRTAALPGGLPASASEAELRARAASLELDLRQRDEQIAQMKREYGALEAARARAEAAGGQEQVEKVLRKLCGPLASLSTLAVAAKGGKDVSAADMAGLVADLERQLASLGLKAIGVAGEQTAFEVAAHQRMSGGAVHAGAPVVVRLPGYRFGERVLQKAMVTAKEEQ